MPAFDGDRDRDGGLHRGDALGDEAGRLHQAGAERARLDAVGRAADIEVDLAIAEALADARRLGELFRVGAAELQGERLLLRVEAEQPLAVAMDDGVGHDHLRVEQRMARQLAMEEAAVPVRPVHHRCNRQLEGVVVAHHSFAARRSGSHPFRTHIECFPHALNSTTCLRDPGGFDPGKTRRPGLPQAAMIIR